MTLGLGLWGNVTNIRLNSTRLYLSLEFLSLLSQLIVHVFIYGANNLVVFTLTSKTEKKMKQIVKTQTQITSSFIWQTLCT